MYEVFSSRVRVFPLIAYDIADLTNSLTQNEEQTLGGYQLALKQLEAQQKIKIQKGYVTITKDFIDQCKDPLIRITNLSKHMPRRLFTSILGVLPQLMNLVSQNTEAFLRMQKASWKTQPGIHSIDPQKYVFFPTATGLVSLSDKIDIKGFTQRMVLDGYNMDIEVKPVGGMLNDVYLINAGEKKVLAKRFKDWSGFKWFPLTLWSFGARSFAVTGQARLAKECAISEFLRSEGFNVPKILHVSNPERIVFMEFIEGESLSEIIKRYSSLIDETMDAEILGIVSKVGEILAKIHGHNVSLGDTKPDNVLIKPDGTIYLIDFEQALQGGNKAWDIAVFLYYCGHYCNHLTAPTKRKPLPTHLSRVTQRRKRRKHTESGFAQIYACL